MIPPSDLLRAEGLHAEAAVLAAYERDDMDLLDCFEPLLEALLPDGPPATPWLRRALLACYASVVIDVTIGKAVQEATLVSC